MEIGEQPIFWSMVELENQSNEPNDKGSVVQKVWPNITVVAVTVLPR
ncbi:hypothetical protein [Xenorhabdus szentirmaii]|uniref:Uncharacterized protein n=1 Tax=Xenorhabdus szentirmaii TaxID=290112 RepID=A0AAW3YTR9_9GAMM|nr:MULTISPECIES: hypothetical protein [unclassified Xenorhabdus]MBD2782239.1 hypothetical protein [Xenorhabdus sp. 38]MBD2801545.1 hypothetical protein [Xenorhabdus sp. M]MBD2806645.1 hypothetical protein [Xenorhabdus sp. ZM]